MEESDHKEALACIPAIGGRLGKQVDNQKVRFLTSNQSLKMHCQQVLLCYASLTCIVSQSFSLNQCLQDVLDA